MASTTYTISGTSNSPTGTTVGPGLATVAMTFTLTFKGNSPPYSTTLANASSLALTLSNGDVVNESSQSASILQTIITFVYKPTVGTTHATGVQIASLNMGTFTIGGITPTSPGSNFFTSTDTITCFLTGTDIATPGGERAVESLRIGDLVSTADGLAKPVKWIGRVSAEAGLFEDAAFRARIAPVVFRAGALGEGLPRRDLRVSPAHGMLIDGVLIPAAALVNDVSILRDQSKQDVTFYHIELEQHDIILSEGAPSETFVDCESRAYFDNAAEYDALYGDEAVSVPQVARVEAGYMLAAIRRRLDALAGIAAVASAPGPLQSNVEQIQNGILSGWAVDRANPSVPVEVEIVAHGEIIGRALANRYRFDLDMAGLAGGRCAFDVAMPASVDSLDDVVVRRAADGIELHSDRRVVAAA